MKVLAVDPGFGRCGIAVVEKHGGREELLYSTCVETPSSAAFAERLAQVVRAYAKLIKKYAPDSIAMEKLYFSKNQKTAMQVAEVRGALLHAAAEAGVQTFEYSPTQVKSATAGYGAADKKQVARMLHALVKIEKDILHDDEYDAIAVGLTHLAYHPKEG